MGFKNKTIRRVVDGDPYSRQRLVPHGLRVLFCVLDQLHGGVERGFLAGYSVDIDRTVRAAYSVKRLRLRFPGGAIQIFDREPRVVESVKRLPRATSQVPC